MSDPFAQPLELTGLASVLGRYRYVELSLFHVLGKRALITADPACCVYLSGSSRSHAYRAELIEARLPVSVGLPDAVASTVSPSAAIDTLLSSVADGDDDAVLSKLLGGWYPAMRAGYSAHLQAATSPSDAPFSRLLRRVLGDLDDRIEEGVAVVRHGHRIFDDSQTARALEECGGPFGTLKV